MKVVTNSEPFFVITLKSVMGRAPVHYRKKKKNSRLQTRRGNSSVTMSVHE